MMLENLRLANSGCDVCGGEKKTETMCSHYIYNDELEDLSLTKESCWSICDDCSHQIKPIAL